MADVQGERRKRRQNDQPPTLGSISRPASAPGPAPRSCTDCGSSAVTQLAMDLSDGTPVTFVSCQACEHRAWFDPAGELIPIESVLLRSRKEK